MRTRSADENGGTLAAPLIHEFDIFEARLCQPQASKRSRTK
jgi:hypothetical protein